MKRICTAMTAVALSLCVSTAQTASKMPDKEQLAIALDYFGSGKYSEALRLLSALDKKYELNPRFKAYMGVCYFYEWNYEMTCKYIDPYLEQLGIYAPHERSIYYFSDAEAHFNLGEYDKSIALYERLLNVCYNKEKGDAYFKLGYCYMNKEEWQNAMDALQSALSYYEKFGYPENKQARVIQITKMINGCKAKTNPETQKGTNGQTEGGE